MEKEKSPKKQPLKLTVDDFEAIRTMDMSDGLGCLETISRTRMTFNILNDAISYLCTGEIPNAHLKDIEFGWSEAKDGSDCSWFVRLVLTDDGTITLDIDPITHKVELGDAEVFMLDKIRVLLEFLIGAFLAPSDKKSLIDEYHDDFKGLLAVWFSSNPVTYTDDEDLKQQFLNYCAKLFVEDRLVGIELRGKLYAELYVLEGATNVKEWLIEHGAKL